jgi:WhiB family redox-sensing transcriptional regulator
MLASLIDDMPDLTGAVCGQVDVGDMFFPTKGGTTKAAKAICRRCPVKEPCLQYALDHPVDGVWGGTSVRERQALARAAGRTYSTVLTPKYAGPLGEQRSAGAA